MNDFQAVIAPFFYVESETGASVCLDVGHYCMGVFQSRAEEGFEGNGYDWAALAQVFLTEQRPDLCPIIKFDPESSMFCAYASDKAAIRDFARAFKTACDNDALIRDLFSRTELD